MEACGLTQFSTCGGCAAKLSPTRLSAALEGLRIPKRDDVLIGTDTHDDAAVIQLSGDLALVQTLDYVTPMIDDPFLFGQVAAANALSDVYAKGGKPLTAMNICNFPEALSGETMLAILEGGLSKITEAGAVLVGGHTIRDPELKYGLSVTGTIQPSKVIRNSTLRAGDVMVLTKRLGTGVMITGYRKGAVSSEALRDVAKSLLAVLNRTSSETMQEFDTHGCTDVTGFGLAGHALWMVKGAHVGMRIFTDKIPFCAESLQLVAQGIRTGVTESNRSLVADFVQCGTSVPYEYESLMYDPQTSGGLLIGVPERQAESLVRRLRERGVADAAIIGEVFESPKPVIELTSSNHR
ncbi:MAG TPA: selenide, water dikinase SelD [Polyangiaceae bacterium]|nr:selenide, water dikinase SelD [Polyangiaceae bacterium]